MVGGDEISATEAWTQMGEEAPEEPQAYEELDDTEQAYVRLTRELEYARAAGDDELAAEVQEEIDALQGGELPGDSGRDAVDDAGVEEQKLDPAEVLAEKRAFAEKYGWA